MNECDKVVYTHHNVSNTVVDFTSKKEKTIFKKTIVLMLIFICFLNIKTKLSIPINLLCILIVLLINILINRNEIIEESVLVIKDFGIQLKKKYASGLEESKFLERSKIEGIVIHEFINGSMVSFSLGFLVTESNSLILSFRHVYPGLEFIKRVYLKCIEFETVKR